MNKKDIEMLIIAKEAKENERCRCLKAVDDEPEFPGAMPGEVGEAVLMAINEGDLAAVLRMVVRLTKRGIRDRIVSAPQ